MNQARIWLVVKPTVGLPLFLGSVATISMIVHASILTHSTWFPAFIEGGQKAKTKAALLDRDAVPSKVTSQFAGGQTPRILVDADVSPSRMATIVFADGRTARITLDRPEAQTREATLRFEDGQTARVVMEPGGQLQLLPARVPAEHGPAK